MYPEQRKKKLEYRIAKYKKVEQNTKKQKLFWIWNTIFFILQKNKIYYSKIEIEDANGDNYVLITNT